MKRIFAVLALASLGLSSQVFAQECAMTIEGNDQLKYNLSEMKFSKSCGEVTVTLKHVGQMPVNAMGHNWVLSKTSEYQAVAAAGLGAGAPEYLPMGDARVIAHTSMIGGGEEASVTFDVSGLEAGGNYTYFCSFPGHNVVMNGKFILE